MKPGADLNQAYSEWRRLALAEGQAIRAGDWRFVANCQQAISQFTDAAALLKWWNSDPSKQARRAAQLSRHDIDGLKALVLERKAHLSTAPVG